MRPHEPTEETRRTVETMSAFGIPRDRIAECIGIAKETLRAHYEHELNTASTHANAAVAKSLFLNATEKMNTTAQIFWLKCRAGWKEAPLDVNLSTKGKGAGDGPPDLRSLTLDELLTLERILGRPRGVVIDAEAAGPAPATAGNRKAPRRLAALVAAHPPEDDV